MTGLTASFGLYDTSGAVAAAAADWWMEAARTAEGPRHSAPRSPAGARRAARIWALPAFWGCRYLSSWQLR
jgi:hypothetical protein